MEIDSGLPIMEVFIMPSSVAFSDGLAEVLDEFMYGTWAHNMGDRAGVFPVNACMAMREAFSNAVEHGNNKDPRKTVRVGFYITDDCLTIHVQDEGEGFDFSNIPDPLAAENLLKEGGRGIMIIKKFFNVQFLFGGRCIQMTKLRPQE